jgi:excinuclease ABC subunit B
MAYVEPDEASLVADPVVEYMTKDQLQKAIQTSKKNMERAAKDMEFMEAAKFRDEMFALEKMMKEKFPK